MKKLMLYFALIFGLQRDTRWANASTSALVEERKFFSGFVIQ